MLSMRKNCLMVIWLCLTCHYCAPKASETMNVSNHGDTSTIIVQDKEFEIKNSTLVIGQNQQFAYKIKAPKVTIDSVVVEGSLSGKHFLIEIEADTILINNLILRNHGGGGLSIKGGYDSVAIQNVHFYNLGYRSGLDVQYGRYIHIKDGYFSDPYGHQRQGKAFNIHGNVKNNDQEIEQLLIENIKSKYTSKATVFIQKVKRAVLRNIQTDYAGLDSAGNVKAVTIIKVDDLGKGNTALIQDCESKNSGSKAYFISLEQSQDISITEGVVIENCVGDRDIRLGANGRHKIVGGKLRNAALVYLSNGNSVDGMEFSQDAFQHSVMFLGKNNSLTNCQIENGFIRVRPRARGVLIEKAAWAGGKSNNRIVLDKNDPKTPNEIRVIDSGIDESQIHYGGPRTIHEGIKVVIEEK